MELSRSRWCTRRKREVGRKRNREKEKELHRTQHAIPPARFVCARADKMRGKRLTYNSGKTAFEVLERNFSRLPGKFSLYTRIYFVINNLTIRIVVIFEYKKKDSERKEIYLVFYKRNIFIIIIAIRNCDLYMSKNVQKRTNLSLIMQTTLQKKNLLYDDANTPRNCYSVDFSPLS